MYFTNHQVRITTQRIHDYLLFNTLAVLKASDLGTFYELKDNQGNIIEEKSCYYFKETDRQGKSLKTCDMIMYKEEDILPIEMKTKLVDDYSLESENIARSTIFGGAAEVDRRLFKQNFLVIMGMYTRENRKSFSFSDSKIIFYFGDQYRREWTKANKLNDWLPILKPASSVVSLFNILYQNRYIK